MEKMHKLISVIKKDGIFTFIRKVTVYSKAHIFNRINIFLLLKFQLNKKKLYNYLDSILKGQCDRIIVWRSTFGWNVELFQRPQHISNNLSKNNCLVFYEVTNMTDKVEDISKVHDNLYLVNFSNKYFSKLFFEKIESVNKTKYIQFYSTEWNMSLEKLLDYKNKGFKVIYEYIDDLSPVLAGTKELPINIKQKYEYAMNNDDVYVVVTADQLKNDVISKRGINNLINSTNGVDYDFFQTFGNYELEKEYLEIINNGKINVGYYGALASWFDYDIIKKIDETNDFNIILFGIRYDDSLDKSGILKLKNVHFMGARDYKVLKYYANKIDILTIPFLINDITRATSPVKLFEYMALKKPIVTTPMNECLKYKSVMIAEKDKFVDQLHKAYSLRNDKEYINLLDKEAKENSWSNKAMAIIQEISKGE